MRLLVTGASGTIGSSVVQLVPDDTDVWTTSRSDLAGKQHVPADLTDPKSVADLVASVQPSAVIHAAGGKAASLDELFTTNILATTNLMSQLPTGTTVVLVGSAAEYGVHHEGAIGETTDRRPVSPYGWAKVGQTAVAREVAQAQGLALMVARPFNVVSASMDTSSALGNIKSQLLTIPPDSKGTVIAGRLDIVRDFVSAGFVARSLVAMAFDPEPGASGNICSGVGLELNEILNAMATQLGVEPVVSLDPDLASLPAPDRVVGDPSFMANRYALSFTPSASDIAAEVLRKPMFGYHDEDTVVV